MIRPFASALLTLLTLLAATVGWRAIEPLQVQPASAASELFSAERAKQHLQAIASTHRMLGTESHREARQYIVDRLQSLGLTPELQEGTITQRSDWIESYHLTNVLTRLEGRDQGKAVLVIGHYDTVPHSPGAGDDASAVAAMLEALRALTDGPQLRNDLIFLFTDGEEMGLLGAELFIRDHPWIEDIGVVLNFEARGNSGPSLMFETGPSNGTLIDHLSQAASRPLAYSYSYEVYSRLPNDTDFSLFKRAGLPGMNFAFIEAVDRYHSSRDSLDALDLRSVQHHGDYLLGLARQLGEAQLDTIESGGDGVYFHLPGLGLISYSGSAAMALTLLGLLAAAIATTIGVRNGKLRVSGLLLSWGLLLTATILVGVIASLLASQLFGSYYLGNGWHSNELNLLALLLIIVAMLLALNRWRGVKLGANLPVAGLLLWTLATVAITVVAVGASYLFAIPLLFASLAAIWTLRSTEEASNNSGLLAVLAALAVATPLLWTPFFDLVNGALGRNAAPILGVLFLLLASCILTAQFIGLGNGRAGRWLPWVTLGMALVLIAIVRTGAGFDSQDPRPNSLFYAQDLESGTATWLSFDSQLDSWTRSFLSDSPERDQTPSWIGFQTPAFVQPAPPSAVDPATVEILGHQTTDSGYQLQLKVSWPYPVHRAFIFSHLGDGGAIRELNGNQIEPLPEGEESAEGHPIRVFAPSTDGIGFALEVDGTGPLELELVSQRFELPSGDQFPNPPRPPELQSRISRATDSSYVRTFVSLDLALLDEADTVPADTVPAADPTSGDAATEASNSTPSS